MQSSATLPPLCPIQTRRFLNLAPGGAEKLQRERDPCAWALTSEKLLCFAARTSFPGSWRADVPLVFHVSQCVSVYTATCELVWYINIMSSTSFSEQSVVVDRPIRQSGFKNKVVLPHLLPKKSIWFVMSTAWAEKVIIYPGAMAWLLIAGVW